jgi:hypothetical protein
MNAFDDSLLRVVARHTGRAIPTRTSSGLSTDPEITIGIATIKIVTEEQIQAIAYGDLDRDPQVIVRLNPIGRDVGDLIPFAQFMNQTADRVVQSQSQLRIWIPNSATLEGLDILGHRYWRNQTAPEVIVRMGDICRVIAHEASYEGQQVVADAAGLLRHHVVTGLAPVEEAHLDALLAWFDETVTDPVAEARERIKLPAAGILPNSPDFPIDDRVDRLRRELKGAVGRRRQILAGDIENNLRRWVLREWRMLSEARQAFFELGLAPSNLNTLIRDSNQRIHYGFSNGHFPARRPDRLAKLLSELEASIEKTNAAELESDPELRDQAGRAGAVVSGVVSGVHQPQRNKKPCNIDVDSAQGVIRFRLDDKVKIAGTNVTGVVRGLASTPAGGTRLSVEIDHGVRQSQILTAGTPIELLRQGYGFVNYRALNMAYQRQPWAYYADAAPALAAGEPIGRSALAIAAEARHR